MGIIEYFAGNHSLNWLDKIESCNWNAAKLLANLLKNWHHFEEMLGCNGELFITKNEDAISPKGFSIVDYEDGYEKAWAKFEF